MEHMKDASAVIAWFIYFICLLNFFEFVGRGMGYFILHVMVAAANQ
jgi:hypothetical protein